MLRALSNTDLGRSVQVHTSLGVKKESTESSSNKWSKIFYQDYLHLYWKLLCDFAYKMKFSPTFLF